MTTPPSVLATDSSLTRDLLYVARYYLGNRRRILIMATIAIVAGIAFNWSWLVASGVLPILLTALPCAVMCGLGLCANKLFGGSCSTESSQPHRSEVRMDQPTAYLDRFATPDSASTCCSQSADASAPPAPEPVKALDERKETHA